MIKPLTLCALLSLGIVGGCGGHPPAPPVSAVTTGERLVVRETMVEDFKPVDAVVATADLAEARARIGGTITRLLVTENDTVRKGQLLAVVSDPRIDFQTRGFGAQALAARAESDRAAANLGRVRTLFERGIYAQARLDDADAADKSAKASLAAALAQRNASAELASQGAIISPGDGRVIAARVPAGSVVAAGQVIVTVASGSPVLRLELPESEADALHIGDAVAVLDEDGRQTGAGAVRKIYPAVNAGRIVADIAAPQASGAPIGQKVTVGVRLGVRRAVVAPARFVISRFGLDYVRLVGSGGGVLEVPVQLAAHAPGGDAEVLAGLRPGDVIVAASGSAGALR